MSRWRWASRRLASRRAVQWLLAIATFLLLSVLSLTAITAGGPATRALARTAAILTEVDTYLDARLPAIQQEAAQTQDPQLTLSDFPLSVSFAPQEVRDANRQQFRALLLARAGAILHEQGAGAFRTDSGGRAHLLSPQGSVRALIDFLRPAPHGALTVATFVLAVLAAFLAIRLAALVRGRDRLSGLGRTVLLGAVPFLVLALAVHFGLSLASRAADDYTTREFLALAAGLAWAPVRDAAIFSVLGGVMLAMGEVLARWPDGPDRKRFVRPLDTAASSQ